MYLYKNIFQKPVCFFTEARSNTHRSDTEPTPLQKGKCEQSVMLKFVSANTVLMQENILIDNIFLCQKIFRQEGFTVLKL
jgi:hypothetical protein